MIPFRKSIGFRLLAVSFILLALPLLVDSFILVQEHYENAVEETKAYLIEVAQLRELPLQQLQPLNKSLIDLIVNYLNLESEFPDTPNETLDEKLKGLAEVGDFYEILLIKLTNEGEYIVTGSNLPQSLGKNYTQFFELKSQYSPTALEQGFTSYIAYDRKTLKPYFIFGHVIYSKNDRQVIGVLAISENLSSKLATLLKPETRKYTVNFALLLPSSVVFASSDPHLKFQYFATLKPEFRELFAKEEPIISHMLPDQPISIDETIGLPFFEFKWEGKEQIGYINKFPETNFDFLTYAAKEEIFETPFMKFLKIYTSYAIILIVGALIAYFLTRRMAKPIRSLSAVMQKIQAGDLNLRYQKDALGFEINDLGNIFNEMIDAVLEQKRVAEEQRVERETYAQELRLGQKVQRGLLPQTMPDYPGVDIAEIYIPAIEVGGDFYDVFIRDVQDRKQLVLAVADASGKGVRACFYSLSVRNLLRTCAREFADIGKALSATNDLFREDTGDTGMFVTVLAGVYDSYTRTFSYQSWGHNPGLVRKENGAVEVLPHLGMAMGVLPSEDRPAHSIQLDVGDTLVLYSDGITEAHDVNFKEFGEKRLIQYLEHEGFRSSVEVVENIVSSVNSFVGEAPQHDDITLLVMKITE